MDPTGGKSVPRLHEIVACRVCLATTGKLFWFGSCGLRQAFLDITGTQVMLADGLPQYICYVCCGLLRKAVQFRKKCHNMHTLLLSLTFSDLIKQINLLHYQPLKRSKIVQLSVGEEFENNLNSFKKEELPDVPNEEEIESVLNLNGEEFNSDLGDKELENDFNLNDKELQDVPNYKKIENKEFKTDLGHKKLENILNFKLKDALNGEVFEKHLNLNDKEYKNSLSDKELENDINASNHNDVELGTESHYDDCEENIDDLTPEVDQHQQVAFKNVKLDKKVNSNSCIVKIMHDTDVDKKVTQYILNDPSADEYRKMLYKHIEDKYMKTTGKDESAHDKEKPVYKIAVNTRRRWRCSNFDFKVKKFYKYLKDKYRCLDIPKSNKLQLYRTKQTMELMKKYNFDTVTFSKEEQIKNMLEKKESDRYKNSIYKCEDCYTGFLYEKKYNNHREYHDSALSGSHECDVCRLKFLTNSLLSRHYYHCHKYRYVCKTCGKKFSTNTQCREHYLEHRGGVTYLCQYCSGVYKKSANLYDHVRIVHGSVYCDICQTLVTPRGLIAHMAKQHRKTYKCQFCEKVFNDSGALENHINTSPDAVCSPNDWPCSTCGHNYSSKSLLEEHIQSCHRNRKAKRCKPLRKQQKNSKRRQLSKSIMCEVCARFCPSVAALNYHLRSHTGERPYKCTSCNKSFCLKTQLQQHLRSHTGERPFRCSDCPKAFASKSNLLRHRLVHSKLRPYTCHICNKKFQQKSCVQLHIRTVHMNTPLPPRIRKRKRKIDEEPEKIIAENKEVGVELENETVDGNEERRNNFKRRSMREIGEKKTKEVEPENGNEDCKINDFVNFRDNDEEMLVENETQDCKDTIEDSDGEIISNCDSDDRQENDKIDYEGEKIMKFLEDWEA